MNNVTERNNVFEIKGVTKIFNGESTRTFAVRDVSLKAGEGEFIILMGPSGSGKTTLLTMIAGLVSANEGTVHIFGKNITHYTQRELQKIRAERIGFIFQNFHLIDSLTVLENISLVQHFSGTGRTHTRLHGMELLRSFKMECHAHKFPQQLSQGEKQRVAVARAIINNPRLIIADEPTASLESRQGFEIINLLNNYKKDHRACVIAASHDIRLKRYADRVVWMEDGYIKVD